MVINNTRVLTNTAFDEGGGIQLWMGSIEVYDTLISGNRVVNGSGGGVWTHYWEGSPDLTLVNTLVVSNTSSDRAGGLWLEGWDATLINSTIADNRAGNQYGGVWTSSFPTQTVGITNSILWGNGGDDLECPSGCTVGYSDLEEGIWPGVGNISEDPLFAAAGDYHLTSGSPCIDAGTADGAPDHDFEGDPRPWGFSVDMGADEYYSATITISEVRVTNVRDTSFTVSWITDIPSDGRVNYGTDPATLDQIAYDDRGAGTADDTHYVTITDLSPSTTYYLNVVSDGTVDDNGGAHYSVTTGPTLGLPGSDTIWGQVFKEDGTTPAEGTIVYITLGDADGSGSPDEAAPLSALVDDTGYWNTNLGNARTADLNAYFTYSASGDRVKLEAQGAADGTGCLLVDTADDSPAADLILNVSTCLIVDEMRLEIGWNHISLPLDPVTPYTAEGVCDEIISQGGDVAEIDRWYASGWDGHICGLPFNDFPIELGSDYFIKSNAVSTWTIEGYRVTIPVPLELQVGWNSIGIPHTNAYTAESLCEEINDQCGDGTAVEVDRWYASGWDGHICGLPFNDFDVEIGKGYFIKASGACTVTPSLAATSSARRRIDVAEQH